MGKNKRVPLAKIRRRALWPSFVFFILICIAVSVSFPIMIAYFLNTIIGQKSQAAYESALGLQSIFEETDTSDFSATSADYSSLSDELVQLERMNPYVNGICLINSSDRVIMRTTTDTPNFESSLMFDNGDFTVILSLASEDIRSANKDNISDESNFWGEQGRFFRKILIERLFNAREKLFIEPNEKVIVIPCWIILDKATSLGYRLCIKTDIFLQSAEIAPFIIAMLITAIFCTLMTIWFLVSFFHQIGDRRRLDAILSLDTVTGGKNWSYFVKTGTKILRRNHRKRNHYAVISLSMRKYTNYCTCYGVENGEALLEKFYTILQKCVEKKEIAVRHERAEFALLLLMEDEASLEQRLKKITFMLNAAVPDQTFHFSTGVYIIDRNEDNITEIYNSAVIARNCCADDSVKEICYFSDEMYNEQVWERKVENDMEKALYNHEFEVYLQPKYDTMKETLSAAEALVRWNHPTEGSVPPGRFIPIFESNGFILQLDDYMLTEVCRLQATWISRGRKVVPISVNVSRAHFTKTDLAEHICRTVDHFNVPHSVIELELTESAFFDDKAALLNTVKKLKNAGFKVSMDDFGAGYSSLNTLKELPLDVVKLDAEFFRGKDEMNRGKLIVEETISLAKKLNMQIVAEGIETREQVDFLKSNGCDLIQGFYFAKPLPISEFEKRAFARPAVLTRQA